ncbi:protein ORF70 [Anguillid herpesvirus 1]|uniref:Protein ORF70 n=1 Tax=Anguillid herpesvirus 1 TaxID=150286 RepID=A0A1J0REC6_9VIRU|nr:protein ORF70 [Anguillid herpesvirus 1]ADA57833.1 protein ORF70 [Anguillid herpesvirus 1]APD76233.1 ORF70 [Anguillid herpesvirus 1]QRM16364.1 protein ORF70 [Anguillid herpesvirus 1]QRM16493.1 protein ORF70 [Anguillid herpesvirus 1]QRM16623.1 protein ORF70 [Anguillid herpesvirus 1]
MDFEPFCFTTLQQWEGVYPPPRIPSEPDAVAIPVCEELNRYLTAHGVSPARFLTEDFERWGFDAKLWDLCSRGKFDPETNAAQMTAAVFPVFGQAGLRAVKWWTAQAHKFHLADPANSPFVLKQLASFV